MKRRSNPPSSKVILSGKYDSNFLVSSYQKLFIGYSDNDRHRKIGSSGGVGSELAYFILQKGLVDSVIGVGFSKYDPTLPEYKVIESPKDVDELSGSKYTYMEFKPLSRLLELHSSKKIAVFVQPCFIKAIRNFQKKKYPNIRYIFSFFCGYNKTYNGTEYLIKKTKIQKDQIDFMAYRWGKYPGGFMVRSKNGKIVRFGKECYELIDLMFLKEGCRICSYYMGEGADVVLGDAWVKNLEQSSIIITRSNTGTNIVEKMYYAEKIGLYYLNEIDLVRMHWHNIKFKKYGQSPFLSFLHVVLRTRLVKKSVPFKLMMLLSRIRRRFAIGVWVNLRQVKKAPQPFVWENER